MDNTEQRDTAEEAYNARIEQFEADDDTTGPRRIPNLDLLRRHVAWVLEQDALPYSERVWDQSVWAEHPSQRRLPGNWDVAEIRGDLVCNTYRCLAGNVVHENGTLVLTDDGSWRARAEDEDQGDLSLHFEEVRGQTVALVLIEAQAERLLGVDAADAEALFDGGNDAEGIRIVAARIAETAGESL